MTQITRRNAVLIGGVSIMPRALMIVRNSKNTLLQATTY